MTCEQTKMLNLVFIIRYQTILKKYFIKYLLTSVMLIISWSSFAQFYNGHQMDFGKNRVQYDEFEWFFLRFNNFDTYFYAGGKQLAMQTAETAYKEMEEISHQLDYKLEQRLIFVIYHNLSDFRQSNIGLESLDNQYNIGGATKIVDNIVFMYVEGDQEELRLQIRTAIAEITLNEILFGVDWKNKLTNSTLLSLPDWYIKGLVSHIALGWNEEIENNVKDGFLTNRYEKINRLNGQDAIYAGQSIWRYISNTYGDQVIPTILYLTKVSKNVESGFLYVLGINLKSLSYSWINYYNNLYSGQYANSDNPNGNKTLKRYRNNHFYQQSKISDDGTKLAFTTNILGKIKIYIIDLETGKKHKILRQGHKLDQIIDLSYPVLKWHPSGKLLGYIIEKKGKIDYCAYNIETKELKKIQLNGFDKVLDFDFSNNGFDIVFNGFRNGQSDIFKYNLASNTFQNLTVDKADDYHPIFIRNSSQILFSSKRNTDSITDTDDNIIPTQTNRDIFLYDFSKTDKPLTQLTKTPEIDEKQAYLSDEGFYIYLSNDNGIYNRFSATFDSTISYIDTTTHYRYFMRSKPITDYRMNIIEQSVSEKTPDYSEIYYNDKNFEIYHGKLDYTAEQNNQENTAYRKSYLDNIKKYEENSAKKIEIASIIKDSLININSYQFEPSLEKDKKQESDFNEDGTLKKKHVNRYLKSFYTTKIINQVDFGFLNASYQRFTGSAFYFNPGFNILMNVEAMDLLENHRITGGFRFAGNFDSNEYLFSYENLEHRLNKQYIFHRLAITDYDGNTLYKSYMHQGIYRLRYPFNQVSAIQSSISLRQDKQAFLSTDYQNLLRENEFDYWAGIKLEYIFDNTRNLMLNINDGSRFKIFGEFYKQVDKKDTDLFVVGCDFRNYIPIHRNLILASRFAASTSFGSAKLIYYLGGIDNWINFSSENTMFDESTRINPDENYVYQAVATNMRGFTQNIRNGNSFAVINTEIRWPIISYLLNRPVNSELLNNFQIIGFFDVGSAWTGMNPFSGENAYENDIYENGPITIVIDNDSYPIVAGYGVGIRTKLFGYFVRLDYAKGIENNTILPGMYYFSLNLDF
jgi:Tol biopolymer transport system component